MKKILIVGLLLIALPLFSQDQNTDLQKVKDALVISVMHCQELERQNANLNATIKRVAEDLKKIQTVQQLDSLKVVYGIKSNKKE
jgi:hypothetical protein